MSATEDELRTLGGPLQAHLTAAVPLSREGSTASATFRVPAGEAVGFAVRWARREFEPPQATLAQQVAERVEDTVDAWRSWEADHTRYQGSRAELIQFSSRVLKGLTSLREKRRPEETATIGYLRSRMLGRRSSDPLGIARSVPGRR